MQDMEIKVVENTICSGTNENVCDGQTVFTRWKQGTDVVRVSRVILIIVADALRSEDVC